MVRHQQDGAPIGLVISGDAGKMEMLSWVRRFMAKMREATASLPDQELYLHQLYVDDNNVAMEELRPGTRRVEGVFQIVEGEVGTDRLMEGDRRTAGLVKDLANTICPYIQMEADFLSNHSSGWMPLLDLEVRIAKDNSMVTASYWGESGFSAYYSTLQPH